MNDYSNTEDAENDMAVELGRIYIGAVAMGFEGSIEELSLDSTDMDVMLNIMDSYNVETVDWDRVRRVARPYAQEGLSL